MLDAEHEALAFMVSCPAWNDLYKKGAAERVKALYKALEAEGISLEKVYDILGQVKAIRWMVTWPENEVDMARIEEQEEEKIAEKGTDARVLYGHSLGADHQGGRE